MTKHAKAQDQQQQQNEAVSADSKAARKARAAESSKVAKAGQKQLMAKAVKDALVLLDASNKRNEADQSTRKVMLERAKELKRSGFALDKESGLHVLHTTYLKEGLAPAMMEKRGEKKPSAYVRRVLSDFSAVFAAVQVGEEIKVYSWPARVVDGKPEGIVMSVERPDKLPAGVTKMNPVKDMAAADLLTQLPGNHRDMVTEARRVKRKMGFISSKGKGSAGSKPLSATALDNIMERIESRLTPKTVIKVLAFAIEQTRDRVPQVNHKYFDTHAEEFLRNAKKALAETTKGVVEKEKRGDQRDQVNRARTGRGGQDAQREVA